jgi:hypothetical protein
MSFYSVVPQLLLGAKVKYLIAVLLLAVATATSALETLSREEVDSLRQKYALERDDLVVATWLPDYAAVLVRTPPYMPFLMKRDGSQFEFRRIGSWRHGEIIGQSDLARERAEQFQKMSKEPFVTVKYGDGSKKLLIVSALDCPVCKRLEGLLSRYAPKLNVTIYYLPVLLNMDDTGELTAFWCAKADKATVWHDWWRGKRALPEPGCTHNAKQSIALYHFFSWKGGTQNWSAYLSGTPYIVREDGTTRLGFPDPENEFLEMFGGIR